MKNWAKQNSYDQTRRRVAEDVIFTTSWRRPIYDVLKTFDLRGVEYVCKATSA